MHKQNLPPINIQQSKQRPIFCQIYCYKPYFIKNNSPPMNRRINESFQPKATEKKHFKCKQQHIQIKNQQNNINKQAKNVKILHQPDEYGQNIMKMITNKINKDKKLIQKRKSLSFNEPITSIGNQKNIKQEKEQKKQDTKIQQNQSINLNNRQQQIYSKDKQFQIKRAKQLAEQHQFQNININFQNKNNQPNQNKEVITKNKPSRSFVIKKKTSLYQKSRNLQKKQHTQIYIDHLINENVKKMNQNKQKNSTIKPIKVIRVKQKFQDCKPVLIKNKLMNNQQKQVKLEIKQSHEQIQITNMGKKQQKIIQKTEQIQKLKKQLYVEKKTIKTKDNNQKQKQQNQTQSKRQKIYSKTNLLDQAKNQQLSILIQSAKSIVFKHQKLPFSNKILNQLFSHSIKNNEKTQQHKQKLQQGNKCQDKQENIIKKQTKLPQSLKKDKKSISEISSRKIRASSIKNIKYFYYPQQKNQKTQLQKQIQNNTASKRKTQFFQNNDSAISKNKKDDSIVQKAKTLKQKEVECFTHKINWGRRNSKRQKNDQEHCLNYNKKQNNFLRNVQTQQDACLNYNIQPQIIAKRKQIQQPFNIKQQDIIYAPDIKQQLINYVPISKQFIQFEDPGLSAIFKKDQFCKDRTNKMFADTNRYQNLNIDDGPLQSLQDLYCQLGSFKQFSNISDNQFKQK